MDVMDAIYHRRAIRDFTDRPVDPELIRFVIAAAVQAPSAINQQPWCFVVVEEREALDRWSRQAKAHLLESMTPTSPLAAYRDHLADPSFNIFYNAPTLIVVCATASESQAIEDCCLAAQNLMLAAHASGLGTCWIGFARPFLGLPGARKELGIPSHFVPVAPIIIGHPRAEVPATPRRHPETHWLTP